MRKISEKCPNAQASICTNIRFASPDRQHGASLAKDTYNALLVTSVF